MRVFIATLLFALMTACLPVGTKLESAIEVSPYLTGTGVIPDRSKALPESPGRAMFISGGTIKDHPTFTFYEVTSANDIEKLIAGSRKALKETSASKEITLLFYEKQVWNTRSGGGGNRGHEKLLKKVVVRR